MRLLIKAAIVFGIIIFLWIPLILIKAVGEDRKATKGVVVEEIARDFGRPQTITTPFLYLTFSQHYTQTEKRETTNDKGQKVTEEITHVLYRPFEYFIPATDLQVDGTLKVEQKYRRIYSTPVYVGDFTFKGTFKLNERQLALLNMDDISSVRAYIEFRVTDIKGLRGEIGVTAGAVPLDFDQERDQYGGSSSKLRAEMDNKALLNGDEIAFAVQLPLNGTSAVALVPTGLSTTVTMAGNWPHPSFYGNHLPEARTITPDGFTATWNTSWLSGQILDKNGYLNNQRDSAGDYMRNVSSYAFGTDLINTVDIYSLVDRAVKYGMLIILLTFLAIFMIEVLSSAHIKVHPVQYGLTGVALVVFYMLLLSMSEHYSFALSYLTAAAACIVLISFYLYFSFKSVNKTAMFAGILTLLYAVIYLLLNVSDYALMLGSVLIFAVVAVVMVTTRKIDWYNIGEKNEA